MVTTVLLVLADLNAALVTLDMEITMVSAPNVLLEHISQALLVPLVKQEHIPILDKPVVHVKDNYLKPIHLSFPLSLWNWM